MRRRVWWVIVIFVVLAPVVWYLGSLLSINKTVNEPFPTTSAPVQR